MDHTVEIEDCGPEEEEIKDNEDAEPLLLGEDEEDNPCQNEGDDMSDINGEDDMPWQSEEDDNMSCQSEEENEVMSAPFDSFFRNLSYHPGTGPKNDHPKTN